MGLKKRWGGSKKKKVGVKKKGGGEIKNLWVPKKTGGHEILCEVQKNSL